MDTAGIFDQIPLENFEFMEVQQPEIPPQVSLEHSRIINQLLYKGL